MKIRLEGTAAEVEHAAQALRRAFVISQESGDFANRGKSRDVRRYLEVQGRRMDDDAQRDGAAWVWTKNDDEISVGSMFGHRTERPMVQIAWGQLYTQVPLAQARLLAARLLVAAEAAEGDALLWLFFQQQVGLGPEERTGLMLRLRELRDQLRADQPPPEPI